MIRISQLLNKKKKKITTRNNINRIANDSNQNQLFRYNCGNLIL